jgi:UMF1 family MFS transporter
MPRGWILRRCSAGVASLRSVVGTGLRRPGRWVEPGPLRDPAWRRREWRAWYVYDWANSAFLTTAAAVLLGPYVTALAERAACGYVGTEERRCTGSVTVLGVQVAAGSLWLYAVALSTILTAVLLPLVGALVDHVGRKRHLLAAFAWSGSAATCLLLLTGGSRWQPVVGLAIVAGLCAGAATVVYNSLLNDIADLEDRDAVSSRGWAAGYLGAGIVLVGNIAFLEVASGLGIDFEAAVRICFVSAGAWWAAWTVVPFLVLRDRPRTSRDRPAGGMLRGVGRSVTSLAGTLRDLPQTARFLVAFIFYNAGIQVVLASAAVYATRELGHSQTVVIFALICVQFVAAPGALGMGRLAERHGARPVIAGGLLIWALASLVAAFIPDKNVPAYLGLAVCIGLVVGGSQALSRSIFSTLMPPGREAEFFGLYQTADRATSWIATLAFGVLFQLLGDYRPAMAVTSATFVIGMLLLARVDLARGREQAAGS